MALEGQDRDDIALRLGEIACEAGQLLRRMEEDIREHRIKTDGSPATAADLAAELLIIERLGESWPGVPVVAEETASGAACGDMFFLVDPLDGTRDFLHRTGEYSVNIALIRNARPIAAALAAPALGRVWIAGETARAAAILDGRPDGPWRTIRVRPAPSEGLVALVSRRHGDDATEACLAGLSIASCRPASSALKFCLIAAGEADVYVRCGPTMEWDTAAGDHILTCAGGAVIRSGGRRLTYGHREGGYLNGPFAALADESLAACLDLPATPPTQDGCARRH